MTSAHQIGISTDRVQSSPGLTIAHLECCICHDILWKPVACQSCETPFCSTCIGQWLIKHPAVCPNRCKEYTERKCPPFIAKILSQLQIACYYQSNGCKEIVSYEGLDKHEIECIFQLQRCSGCQLEVLKKDFNSHENSCESIIMTCSDCKLSYKRADEIRIHTDSLCLKEQLRQLRNESQENKREINELNLKLHELCILNPWMQEMKITFEDLPLAIDETKRIPTIYRGLKWNNLRYGNELYLKKKHPKSGYMTSFINGVSSNVAFFKDDVSIGVVNRNEKYTCFSLAACAAWNDDLQLSIIGLRSNSEDSTYTTTLLFGKPKFIFLHWKDIEKLILKSSGGNPHPNNGGSAATHVILNQLTVGLTD